MARTEKQKQRLPAENLTLTLYQGHWLEQRWPWVILRNGRAVPRGTNAWMTVVLLPPGRRRRDFHGATPSDFTSLLPPTTNTALYQPHLPIPQTLWASATSVVLLSLFSAHNYRKAKKIVNSTFPYTLCSQSTSWCPRTQGSRAVPAFCSTWHFHHCNVKHPADSQDRMHSSATLLPLTPSPPPWLSGFSYLHLGCWCCHHHPLLLLLLQAPSKTSVLSPV